jgi:H+/Cl- antiporter ClcA
MSISAGFAAVFGTPLAGAIFGIEVLVLGRMRYDAILPSLLAALLGHYICTLTGVAHTHYTVDLVPELAVDTLLLAMLAGVIFGLTAFGFSRALSFFTHQFNTIIRQPMLRPVAGGVVLAAFFLATGFTKYAGLGVPVIQSAFTELLPIYDFAIKSLLTAFTLGAGFKGGEVTPLFYIGATAGNALSQIIPLPVALLAGMGFVAVFAGATNTPIACTLMGIELFGAEPGIYLAIACICAYFFSGHSGIYGSQMIGSPKHLHFIHYKGDDLDSIQQRLNKKAKT